jgi:hypothetical protein
MITQKIAAVFKWHIEKKNTEKQSSLKRRRGIVIIPKL